MRKKKIVIHTDWSLANTGFGRFAKALIKYLYLTGKYEIVHYCMNISYSNPDLKRTPWKSVGCIPDNQNEVNQYINQFPPDQREPRFREMAYGAFYLDKVITEESPDVYFGVQDIWGVNYAVGRKWFQDITSVIWTTLDSLPLLPMAVELAPLIKNYWIWSDFATKEFHRLGHQKVETVHGAIETDFFKRLPEQQRLQLRQINNIAQNAFIIGFVFRNQLRKSVPNMLEGYKLFKEQNKGINSKLLFHTSFAEGWNIHRLAGEYNIDVNDILTTYVCKHCRNYEVKPFTKQGLACKFCGAKDTQNTTNVVDGVTETQLNEVYNLMDVYCHPFTSGGQEIPVEEAKLAELVTLVTNYSCGEELCYSEAKSLPLDWTEYREHGTEFRKASTTPESISKQLGVILRTPVQTRLEWGRQARKWVLDNFSVQAIGKKVETFIDNSPFVNDKEVFNVTKSPTASIGLIIDNKEWVKMLYRKILKTEVLDNDPGLQHWLTRLQNNEPREGVENYFRRVAEQENIKLKGHDFELWLNANDKGKRILVVMPESIGDIFLVTSLFESLKKVYPEYSLYVATKHEFFDVLACNPYVTKIIPYIPQMESLLWLEGQWNHDGFFEIAFLPFIGTQRFFDYQHNGKDKIQYDIRARMIKWDAKEPRPQEETCTL